MGRISGQNGGQFLRRGAMPPAYVVEAGGLPRPGDTSDELRERFARKLGFIRRVAPPRISPERFTDIELGNPELPVYGYKAEIIETVKAFPVTLIVAETGAGKSTQVPQFLAAEGFDVVMTQPRRLAAEMLANQIGRELFDRMGPETIGLVGYHTAEINTLTPQSRISVVTDGLRLAQELHEQGDDEGGVIIIDEAHEANTNIEINLALIKHVIEQRPHMRVVIMSATVEAQKYQNYFEKEVGPVPVIEIPGRSHEVTKMEKPEQTVTALAVEAAALDQSVLVFLPGVREIEAEIAKARKLLDAKGLRDIPLLPLHGNLSRQQQSRIEASYDGPRIIFATNVAQTSITIPDVDVVIDSGLERRIEIDKNGVESLQLGHASYADCMQRAGRCGRTKPGIYILTRMTEEYDFMPLASRPAYPTPEILRTNVHKNTLAVAAVGLDFSELKLLHPVNKHSIDRSKYHLRMLGAFDDANQITQRGLRMNQFPVRPSLARMLVYAEELNFSPELKSYVAAMVACVEVGDLPNYMNGEEWRSLSDNTDSDLLAQLDMFIWAQDADARQLWEQSINVRHLERAQELQAKLVRRMSSYQGPLPAGLSPEDKDKLVDCILAGMVDFVYEKRGSEYVDALNRYPEQREISGRSVVRGGKLVVGTPYRIPPGPVYRNELHILQQTSNIGPRRLGEVANRLCTWEDDGIVWRDERPRRLQRQLFRAAIATGEWREVEAGWDPALRDAIVERYTSQRRGALRELLSLKKELEQLWHLTAETERLTQKEIDKLVAEAARTIVMSPGELDAKVRALMARHNVRIDHYVTPEKRHEIEVRSPLTVDVAGLTIGVRYRAGLPYLEHPDQIKAHLMKELDTLQLPDGRDILISHRTPSRTKHYTLQELRRVMQD